VPLLGVVAGTFGLPRWIVSRLTKRRQNKFIDECANAIDVIVRGVKSGLPLPECLAIIIAIQQQSGGNLSEVLGNLSGVLRARKRSLGKVRALSAEAKASAAVLGALPFVVMILVYTGISGIKAVATALIQAERDGTPVAQALRVMARENRDMRMAEAEMKATALPPKLTVPMIIFFLPVLFVVILGPALIQVFGYQWCAA
jgi:Flp pilus assembly protein TadB